MSSQAWLDNEDVLSRVRTGLVEFIYGKQAAEKDSFDEQEFSDIRTIFNGVYPPTGFASPGDYVAKFKAWFSSHGYIYHSLKRGSQVTITRSYPTADGGQVSISIGGSFQIGSDTILARVNDGLLNMIEAENSRLQSKMVKGWVPPQSAIRQSASSANPAQLGLGEKPVYITHLDTLYQNNRKMVRAFGGEFTKHGIPVYQEVLRHMELDEQKMVVAEYVPVNRTAIVKMKDDNKNPLKVIGWLD